MKKKPTRKKKKTKRNVSSFLLVVGSSVLFFLGLVASFSYQLGDIALLIPPEWKAKIAIISASSSLALRLINDTIKFYKGV